MPNTDPAWRLSAAYVGDQIGLRIKGPIVQSNDQFNAYFFPNEADTIATAGVQEPRLTAGQLDLLLQPATGRTEPIRQLVGVLVASDGFDDTGQIKALLVEVPVRDKFDDATTATGTSTTMATPAAEPAAGVSILVVVAFALLGGLILNIMPCVFPVLSIKILSFVSQSGGDRAAIRRHGYAFGLGVVVSFWALASLLLALRAGGEGLGWGFQLQSPWFVAAMAMLLFAVGMNLIGVFEIGAGVIGLAARLTGDSGSGHGGYGGSFMSGVLATALATPCAAPFMATAVGAALAMPTLTAMLVFTCLGVGMAAPYVLLSLAPQLLAWLPRPGAWMESFKQFMAFPLFATTAWLVSVFAQQTDNGGLVALLLGLVLLAIGAWILGRWAVPARGGGVRRAAKVVAGVVLASALVVALGAGRGTDDGLAWEPYSASRVDQLRAEGRPVFVDFTATWCLTCKWNELGPLSSAEVAAKFREKNVALLKADWTRQDPAITSALEAFGRSSVPLYLYYPPDTMAAPQVLPTLLTTEIIVRAVDGES